MKAKILFYKYSDGSGMNPVKIYMKSDSDQANEDLEMMQEYASDCRNWELKEIPIHGIPEPTPPYIIHGIQEPTPEPYILEALESARAVMEAAGISKISRIGGEQYIKVLNAIAKLKG